MIIVIRGSVRKSAEQTILEEFILVRREKDTAISCKSEDSRYKDSRYKDSRYKDSRYKILQ